MKVKAQSARLQLKVRFEGEGKMKQSRGSLAQFVPYGLVLIFLLLSSCALTEEHINVGYVPQTGVSKLNRAQDVITRVQVIDQRESKGHVAHKANAYGMEMAEIIADNDIPQTVRSAVESELTNRGFVLGPNGSVIVIQLTKFENQYDIGWFSGTAVSEVTMNVSVRRRDGTIIYTKLIDGKGVNAGTQIHTGENARIALEAALKEATAKLFSDSGFLNSLFAATPAAPSKT